MRLRTALIFISLWLCAFSAPAIETGGEADTVPSQLHEVVVTASRRPPEIIPAQTLDGEQLRRLNSNSVADALRYFSGLQVKDYGGVGGIKTVNIRSMGTNHTGVSYDGVELGNAQNGQIDLGQFSLDNMEAISLYNGQKSNILQPAKDYGSAGSIYMRTRVPRFAEGEKWHLRASFRTGSFDLINPAATAEVRLSDRVNASLSAEWVRSSGRYKFRYRRFTTDGNVAYDTTAVRQNGDINATRVELNLNGSLMRGSWSAKAYNYISNRGVPGAIVNNVWRRGERIGDNNTFVQGRYTAYLGRFTSLNNIKYAFYRTHYLNKDAPQGKIDNHYYQTEAYASTANQYELTSRWKVSASYDLIWTSMHCDLYGFRRPNRFSHYLAAATALSLERFKVQASALGTFISDRVECRPHEALRKVFTPAIYLSGYPLRSEALTVRAFYKRSYRMPTFNDLYYADMGNSALEPERVTQYNAGITLALPTEPRGIISVNLTADAYYNKVRDKIVAYPKGQQFRWSMLNLGVVDIKGVDIAAEVKIRPLPDLDIAVHSQYTFQRAIDVTNPADSYYRNQIPYIPRHSASAVLSMAWRRWGLNYSWIYAGERYNQQENTIYNYMRPWSTSDLSLSRDFNIRRLSCRMLAEINNLFSRDYDVVLNYPMPKRNFRITLSVEI